MAQIIIEAEITTESWQYPDAPQLWIYASAPFHTAAGQLVQSGTTNSDRPHLVIQCSLVGKQLLIPSFELASISDSPDNTLALYTAVLSLVDGRKLPFLSNFTLNSTPPNTTWLALFIQTNSGRQLTFPSTLFATLFDVQTLINIALASLRTGSPTQIGMVAIDQAAVDPSFPIATSANSNKVAKDLGTATLTAAQATTVVSGAVKATSIILASSTDSNITGNLRVSNIVVGVSFKVQSNNGTDFGSFGWVIWNP